jgi:hypothetical protein
MTQSSLEYQKRPETRLSRRILQIAVIVLLVAGSLAFAFWYVAMRPWQELSRQFNATSTPIAEYPQRLAEWQPSGLMSQFPATIPPQATNVGFYHYPGALQGAGDFELRLQLPATDIAMIEVSAQKLSQNISQQDQLEPMFRVLGATPAAPSPKISGYTTYFLYQRTGTSDEKSAGITISRSTNTVVYWAIWR